MKNQDPPPANRRYLQVSPPMPIPSCRRNGQTNPTEYPPDGTKTALARSRLNIWSNVSFSRSCVDID